jgi:uncharacterized membrane protein
MPAIMIRQLDALAKVFDYTTSPAQHEVLLAQADMILRSSEESVPEQADRVDVRARYEHVQHVAERRLAQQRAAAADAQLS